MEHIENSFCNLISVEFVVRPIDLRLKWHILNLSFIFMQGENFVPGSGTSGTFSGVLEMSIYATLSCNLRVRDRVPGLCGTTLNQCLSTVAHIITCVPISLIFPPRDLSVSISPSCGIVASHSSRILCCFVRWPFSLGFKCITTAANLLGPSLVGSEDSTRERSACCYSWTQEGESSLLRKISR